MNVAVPTLFPNTRIRGGAVVRVMPRIGAKLGHVSEHIIESEGVGRPIHTNRRRSVKIGAASYYPVWIDSLVARVFSRYCITKIVGCSGTSAACVFPLRF